MSFEIPPKIQLHHFEVRPDDIPQISENTKALFKELGATSKGEYLEYPLKGKAQILTDTIQKLEHAKEHKKRDKICAVLRSALAVAVLAAGILGVVFMAWCPPAALGIAAFTVLACSLLSIHSMKRSDISPLDDKELIGPEIVMWMLIGGVVLPLYELGKIPRLEERVTLQKKEVEEKFLKMASSLKNDYDELKTKLEEGMRQCEKSLKSLEELPMKTQAGKEEIEEKLERYNVALGELEKAKAYYDQSTKPKT